MRGSGGEGIRFVKIAAFPFISRALEAVGKWVSKWMAMEATSRMSSFSIGNVDRVATALNYLQLLTGEVGFKVDGNGGNLQDVLFLHWE